jgi:hypothetical protein
MPARILTPDFWLPTPVSLTKVGKQDEGLGRKLHLLFSKNQGGSIWHDTRVPSAGCAGGRG